MRAAPLPPLPVNEPEPLPQPTLQTVAEPSDPPAAPPQPEPIAPSNPEFAWAADFVNVENGATRTETVIFDQDLFDECGGDGPTGAAGRELALRVAKARVGKGWLYAGRPDSLRFDMQRLQQSMQ